MFKAIACAISRATGWKRLLALGVAFGLASASAWPGSMNVAFYYGTAPFPSELRAFDTWVVEPANISDPEWISKHQERLFAYVSVGEVTSGRPYFSRIPGDWLRGNNRKWQSRVIDQTAPEWPQFFVDQVVAPLHRQGYRNFFLDTLDSYHLVAASPEDRSRQEQGLVRAIRQLKTRYPDAKLIINRGFEILPHIGDLVFAVAAESLFRSWDNEKKQYAAVPIADRQWLTAELARVRDQYRLPVIVIDYVAPADRVLAREVAKQIRSLGFIPWVTNGDLTSVGVGAIEALPRHVLMVFDGKVEGKTQRLSTIHRYAAMPLNYLGYVPEYLDISRDALPDIPLAGRYAGIVTWLHGAETTAGPAYGQWLLRQIVDGLPVAVLDSFGFELTTKARSQLDLTLPEQGRSARQHPVRVVWRNASAAFEIEPLPAAGEFFPLDAGSASEVWLRTSDGLADQHAVAITRWGGYALAPFTVSMLLDSENARWVIDPIAFFKRSLRLPDHPVPDVTTENGRRLLLTHIDGDGFANKSEFDLGRGRWAAEVLYDEILRRYTIPHTVSIIEGETASDGRYPELSGQLEAVARRIFALPHVEAASHTFSHPFRWEKMIDGRPDEYSLGIPGYSFDEAREVDGSVAYVNRLLPAGKRCQVYLWSGNCMPGGNVLGRAYAAGLLNMNGGETIITKANHSLTAVGPLGISEGGHLQVFAPNQNENRYTNLWTGPFYGYERVIETFELTERPLRLKPINIYYHTYSASKIGSLKALKKVYDWALKQPVFPVYASTYIRKVIDFHDLAIAHDGEGWRIFGGDEVRTLRIPGRMGFPDLGRSEGVVGWWDEDDTRYIHLDGRPVSRVVLEEKPDAAPRLARANARLQVVPGGWRFEGYRPLEVELSGADKCRVLIDGKAADMRRVANDRFAFQHSMGTATVGVRCGR